MMEQALFILINVVFNVSIWLILSLSLNIEVGFANIPQFGRLAAALVGSLAVGGIIGRVAALLAGQPIDERFVENNAYAIMVINSYLSQHPLISVLLLVLALVTSVLLGALIGVATILPAVRLSEAYLGITLLSIAEVLRTFLYNYDPIIGGTRGVSVPAFLQFLNDYSTPVTLALMVLMAITSFAVAEAISRSPLGRAMRAIRDSEVAAEVYGRDVMKIKIYAVMIGSAMAALAGALYTIFTGSSYANDYSRFTWTFLPWAYIMLGGVGNNVGVLLAVIVMSVLRSFIQIYKHELASHLFNIDPSWLEYIIIGLIIILITLFRPQGMLPEKPVFTLPRRRIEEIRKRVLEEKESS